MEFRHFPDIFSFLKILGVHFLFPREFIEIWKDVSLRLILKGKGDNQDCLTWDLENPQKEGLTKKRGGKEFWKLFCLGGEQMTYLAEERVCMVQG